MAEVIKNEDINSLDVYCKDENAQKLLAVHILPPPTI